MPENWTWDGFWKGLSRWVAGLIPVVVFLVVLRCTIDLFKPAFGGNPAEEWTGIAKVVIAAGLAALAALLTKRLMSPLVMPLAETAPAAAPADPDTSTRNRIAPLVLIWGSLAITVLTLVIIICFTILAAQKNYAVVSKIDTLITGTFGAVLPILATWVGTVIAFYFSNAAFETAAKASKEAASALAPSGKKVTEAMILYRSIVKIEVERLKAPAVAMAEVVDLMKPPVTRVIIFEAGTQSPIFIIRRNLLPRDWVSENPQTKQLSLVPAHNAKTVQDYRAALPDANDASTFAAVAPSATLTEAAAQMRAERAHDVFVTATGQKSDTIGWLPEDRIIAG